MRLLIIAFCSFFMGYAQQAASNFYPLISQDNLAQKIWVDSVFSTLTLEQKIGQLFMVQAYSNKDAKHEQEIHHLIQNHYIGGLIFMQGTPSKQIDLYNTYQAKSNVPLLIGLDGEWGLSMRIKPSFAYPWNMTLGAVQNDSLIYQVGKQIGKHCKEVGVHINFAPVVDINTNPLNPIIGNRSFGEAKENVAKKSIAFINGMQSEGVMANAKHFPGHGDTAADSHKTLPVVNFNWSRLDSVELYPYKQLVRTNLASVMVAHLEVAALQTNNRRPTSISKKVVTNLLKKHIGFKGLVFTDALNMKGVANYTAADSVALEALKAGNDMLLIPVDVEKGIAAIKKSILEGAISEARLDSSVVKVLRAKYWAGLSRLKKLDKENISQRIHTTQDDLLYKKVAENAVTLVKNSNHLLPVKALDTLKIASLSLGESTSVGFVTTLQKYTKVDALKNINNSNYKTALKNYNTVIIGVHKSNEHPWKPYQLTANEITLIQKIAAYKKVVLTLFTSPYALLKLEGFKNVSNVVVAYQNHPVFQSVAAQQIFGALPFLGKLPVSVSQEYKVNWGIITKKIQRLQYGFPEEVGMRSNKLARIDSVAQAIVQNKITPGLQVLVARKGKVIFNKAYGYYTYAKNKKVTTNSMYDLASLTKILGAFPLLVKALEKGVYKLDSTLGELLPEYQDSPLADLLVIDMFAHQSGLEAWIPFYVKTLDSLEQKPNKKWYKSQYQANYSIKVAENLFLKNEYIDSIYAEIKKTPLRKKRDYKYSGLPFFLFKKVVEKYYQQPMDVLLKNQFTNSLGTTTLQYNPLQTFPKDSIVPSEVDTYFRHQTLQGNVHDMAAAMFGGVSGNAGLFGNANDVAKMMQLYLNKGSYGGKQYFRSNVMDIFNTTYFKSRDNRRALILDKPSGDKKVKNTCNCVSMQSFGHSGFTGTFAWADPETELVYVFLSNRTYPTMENNELGTQDIRTKVQAMVQNAIVE